MENNKQNYELSFLNIFIIQQLYLILFEVCFIKYKLPSLKCLYFKRRIKIPIFIITFSKYTDFSVNLKFFDYPYFKIIFI